VVAEGVKTACIVVEGKAEIGDGSSDHSPYMKGILYLFPGQVLQMDIDIFRNVIVIIEMPFSLEAVSVNDRKHHKKGTKGKYIPPRLGKMPLHI